MEGMEKALTKLGSFTISRKAKKELSAIGDDISVSARLAAISLFSLPFLRNQLLAAIALDPLPLISTLPWGGEVMNCCMGVVMRCLVLRVLDRADYSIQTSWGHCSRILLMCISFLGLFEAGSDSFSCTFTRSNNTFLLESILCNNVLLER